MRGLPGFQQIYASFAGITEQMGLAGHGAHTFWGLLTRTAATIAAHTLLRTCPARAQVDSNNANNSPVTHLRGLCIREISVTVVQKVKA